MKAELRPSAKALAIANAYPGEAAALLQRCLICALAFAVVTRFRKAVEAAAFGRCARLTHWHYSRAVVLRSPPPACSYGLIPPASPACAHDRGAVSSRRPTMGSRR
jgi:hypothetical protein